MMTRKQRFLTGTIAATALVAGGSALWWRSHEEAIQQAARERLTYRADGYGGFRPSGGIGNGSAPSMRGASPSPTATAKPQLPKPAAPQALALARTAYASGDYRTAEAVATKVIAAAARTESIKAVAGSAPVAGASAAPDGVSVASARHLMAFAAARRGDLKTARTRFARAREDAEALPKSSPSPPPLGEMPQPTLAEDAAYQHAACTMGLGDKAGAERELVQFVRDFPESPLVHGAMRRIARLHGGDIPKDAEAVWKSAQAIQRKHQEERDRAAAMCGPESLAYVLPLLPPPSPLPHRNERGGEGTRGRDATALPSGSPSLIPMREGAGGREQREIIESLAREMKTGADGTTLSALVGTAKLHGFPGARGVRLSEAGLKKQALPLIALVAPGHFVVVSGVSASGVTVWDAGNLTPPPPLLGGEGEPEGTRGGVAPSVSGTPSPRRRGGGGVRFPGGEVKTIPWQLWRQMFNGVAVSGLNATGGDTSGAAKGSIDVISKQ